MTRARRRIPAGVAARVLAAVLLGAPAAAGAAADAGARLYRERGCVLCHGPEGREPAKDSYPVLAGQRRAYLAQQLRDLRSGLRSNGRAAVMREFVERLDDAEIDALARWLSARTPCAERERCWARPGDLVAAGAWSTITRTEATANGAVAGPRAARPQTQ